MTGADLRLSVARTLDRCSVLGPGRRAVLWVQGCPLRCRGCVAAETLPFTDGPGLPVTELVDRMAGLAGIEGITISGGEPFTQAAALVALLDGLRAERPELSAMAYSGFRIETLRRGTPAQRDLLDRLDLLVDGPYVASLHADLRWRGSSNQRLHRLSPRYADLPAYPDTGAGIEFSVGLDGSLSWAGVPAVPGFREELERRVEARGFALRTTAEPPDRPDRPDRPDPPDRHGRPDPHDPGPHRPGRPVGAPSTEVPRHGGRHTEGGGQ
ncbi:4Fe-4S single cluster domain-containing protein [Streptomyces sp. BE303]|uniref:4Fe-4S single cluster domain-containing protein n=1 Tax=Streptomyces sp. BE303 TaxID=3002528 RepID=UPI002E765106|nr:4Fe-4S single cluster domain-containing protein [Streptomyces sp. BE303]MED7953053.1 4Fe-4S single cluster domain-containing protein [Streptomyces sp. BE303]